MRGVNTSSRISSGGFLAAEFTCSPPFWWVGTPPYLRFLRGPLGAVLLPRCCRGVRFTPRVLNCGGGSLQSSGVRFGAGLFYRTSPGGKNILVASFGEHILCACTTLLPSLLIAGMFLWHHVFVRGPLLVARRVFVAEDYT